mgnify:FL=1
MSEELRNIMMSGFMIFPSNGKFILKKQAVQESDFHLDETEFSKYEDAIEFAIKTLKQPRMSDWTAIVRFNRGLGIEYKNLKDMQAETYEDACVKAEKQAESLFYKQKVIISEIKVRRKN